MLKQHQLFCEVVCEVAGCIGSGMEGPAPEQVKWQCVF